MEPVDDEAIISVLEKGLWGISADLCRVESETHETSKSLVEDNCTYSDSNKFTRIETVQV